MEKEGKDYKFLQHNWNVEMNKTLRFAQILKQIFMNDKTVYNYSGKNAYNRFGQRPARSCKRYNTPAEIAQQAIKEMGYYSVYDVPADVEEKDD